MDNNISSSKKLGFGFWCLLEAREGDLESGADTKLGSGAQIDDGRSGEFHPETVYIFPKRQFRWSLKLLNGERRK